MELPENEDVEDFIGNIEILGGPDRYRFFGGV